MKHLYTSILLLLITSSYTFSQSSLSDEAIENSEYVFEGTVLSFELLKDSNENYLVSYLIKVNSSYKGGLQSGNTVELVTLKSETWSVLNNGEILLLDLEKPRSQIKGLSLRPNLNGVFLVNRNTSKKTVDSSLDSFEPYCEFANCFYAISSRQHYDEETHRKVVTQSVLGFNKSFNSREEFDLYLEKQDGINIDSLWTKKKDVEFLKRKEANESRYEQRKIKALEYQNYLNNRRENSVLNQEKLIENISYEILNETVTGVGTQFYEFDIFISGSSSNTYFDNSAFVVEFNTFAFGVDLSLNNAVTLTKIHKPNQAIPILRILV